MANPENMTTATILNVGLMDIVLSGPGKLLNDTNKDAMTKVSECPSCFEPSGRADETTIPNNSIPEDPEKTVCTTSDESAESSKDKVTESAHDDLAFAPTVKEVPGLKKNVCGTCDRACRDAEDPSVL